MKITSFCCSNCDDNLLEWHSKLTVRGEPPLHYCQECTEVLYDFAISHLPHHVKDKNNIEGTEGTEDKESPPP